MNKMSYSLYPSLEDFKYDILMNSKHASSNIGTHLRGINGCQSSDETSLLNGHHLISSNHSKYHHHLNGGSMSIGDHHNSSTASHHLYPSFNNNSSYSNGGLHHSSNNNNQFNLTDHHSDLHSLGAQSSAVSIPGKSSSIMIAPLSGYSQAHKLQPTNAIRPIVVCKDASGKVGLRLTAMQGGVFVVLVYALSPAAMAGLKFGDQILEINDIPVAGHSMEKVHDLFKKAAPDEFRLVVRDRPFERTVTLHKDQNGLVGFLFSNFGKIVKIVKDSSAARNGLLIDHNIIEINAQNIVGFHRSEIKNILDNCGDVVVLTIVPSKIFEHMIQDTNPRLIRKNMDHTSPDI